MPPPTNATTSQCHRDARTRTQGVSHCGVRPTAGGAIVDEPALLDVLRERRIAGAALDVCGEAAAPPPPPPPTSPLYTLDNVILTPHIGWQRLETRQRVVDMVAQNIEAFARGEPMNVVN